MTQQEYESRLSAIKKKAQSEEMALVKEYGFSMAIFKVGDIIRDSRWTMRVDKISVGRIFDSVEPVYKGIELKKDLTPRKDGNVVSLYGNTGVELIKSTPTEG